MCMFEVGVKCGHVGKGNYIEKTFAVQADTAKEAAQIARLSPRVKHHHKDAIRYVEKVDELRFSQIIEINRNDPYFKCKNIQEQRELCDLEIRSESDDVIVSAKRSERPKKVIYHGKKNLRNPKKYINNYLLEERYAI